MGVFEDPRFAAGTRVVAEAVAEAGGVHRHRRGRLRGRRGQFGLADEIDHVSTGGGASLELLENGDLPGLEALREDGLECADRKPLISGNWKMNLNHFEAIARRWRSSATSLTKDDYEVGRRLGAPAVHRHPHRADLHREREGRHRDRRPELPLGGEGGLHRRGVPGDARQAQRAPT